MMTKLPANISHISAHNQSLSQRKCAQRPSSRRKKTGDEGEDKKTPTRKPPAKKAPAKKPEPKKTAEKKPAVKKAPSKKTSSKKKKAKTAKVSTWQKKLAWLAFKIGLVVLAILLVIGIYLDNVVRSKMDGQTWQLPSVVYGRVLTLEPGLTLSLPALKRELDVLQYHKVAQPSQIGEYAASSHSIEFIRRAFDFPTGKEGRRHVKINFSGSEISSIVDMSNNRKLGYVRLEPKMLGMLGATSDEQRMFLPLNQFPKLLSQALITTEDRDFYEHDGVSPMAIARALFVNLRAGRTVQGGSTLTQQLAKNLFLSRERSLWRKIREAYIAVILDYRYSKDRILEAYLNEVYMGQNGGKEVHGFALGARLYFGRPVQELAPEQLAMLVGMVKGPSQFNPWRHPERTRERRDLVLRLLMDNDIISGQEYELAASKPLGVQKAPQIATRQPAYFDLLRRELRDSVGDIYQLGYGLKIFSTLDPVSQQDAEDAVEAMVPQLNKRAGMQVETAMVAADRMSGEIRAMIGGSRTGYAGFNRALDASRQIGSLVKPAVYLSALRQPNRYTLATTLDDKPIVLRGSNGDNWKPRNYDRKYRGAVPLYLALAKSLNVPTVNLGLQVGLKDVIHTLSELGVNPDEVPHVPSILLGSFTLTPLEVTQMFQSIASGGKRAPLSALRAVMTKEGKVVYQHVPKYQQVVPLQAAWLTTYAMKRVVSEGTARYLQSKFGYASLAGKTGTTDKSRDSWFAGADGREVVAIWVGRDDNKSVRLTGSSGALRIYGEYLTRRKPESLRLPWPQQIRTVKYQRLSNGTLRFDCGGNVSLPAWDKNGSLKAACQGGGSKQPAAWIQNMFAN
ncbi:TPA: penicillin-binding protein 1B [Photobacterium damselae]